MEGQENLLLQVLNTGFEKAAYSFSKFINKNIRITNSKSSIPSTGYKQPVIEEEGSVYVLLTRVIGDVTGLSFLILNEDETQEIIGTLTKKNQTVEFHEAYLLEIDNIVSAPVVAEISKAFNIEIYGDVPQLFKIQGNELNSFILSEMIREESKSIVTNTTFQFDDKNIHPQFIWKLNRKILEIIPNQPCNAVGL